MRSMLFLVHGMGQHPLFWDRAIVEALEDAASQYGLEDRLEREVALVPVTYDQVFDGYLDDLAESARKVREAAVLAGQGGRFDELMGALDLEPDGEKAFWTHAGDVLLYRYLADVTERVRRTVLEQIVRGLRRREAGTRVYVLAHSLGTAVTQDSLDLLGQHPFDGSRAYLAANNRGLFSGLYMLANVHGSVVHDRPRDATVVRPYGSGGTPYCRTFTSAVHEWDPFLSIPFPPFDGEYYDEVGTEAVYDWNTHGWGHYIADPRVHVPLLNDLLGVVGEPDPIPPDVAAAAREAYDAGGIDPGPARALVEFCDRVLERLGGVTGAFHVAGLGAAVYAYASTRNGGNG